MDGQCHVDAFHKWISSMKMHTNCMYRKRQLVSFLVFNDACGWTRFIKVSMSIYNSSLKKHINLARYGLGLQENYLGMQRLCHRTDMNKLVQIFHLL